MGFLAYLVATATMPGGEAYRDAFSLVIWVCRAGPGAGSRSSAWHEAAGGTLSPVCSLPPKGKQ